MFNISSAKPEPMNTAKDLFESELKKRGVVFSSPGNGLYEMRVGATDFTVSLENVSRTYNRDKNPESIVFFVDQLLAAPRFPIWEEAKSLVYFSAERSDNEFGDTLRETISDSVSKVMVLTDLKEGKITWLTPDILKKWRISTDDAKTAILQNMARLIETNHVQTTTIDGMKLGMVPIASVFKASVIFAPNFKKFVSQDIGWPVLAVIPCRDFIYIIAEKDKVLLNRMSEVVQDEFRNSGYPLTTEVLKISDSGIEAIGKFPE